MSSETNNMRVGTVDLDWLDERIKEIDQEWLEEEKIVRKNQLLSQLMILKEVRDKICKP